jgi:hypothetical protein
MRVQVSAIVFKRVSAALCFFLVLYVGNILASYLKDPALYLVLDVFNDNLLLLVVMWLLFVVGGVLGSMVFPISLAALPVNAAAAVLFLAFLFNAFELADALMGLGVAQSLRGASHLLYALLIIVVLLASYLKARKGAEAAEKES